MIDTASDMFFRLTPGGSLDTTFGPAGAGGIVTFPAYVGTSEHADIIIDGSRILLGGSSYAGLSVFAYTLGGIVDASFGENGVAGVMEWNGGGNANFAVQANGEIVVAGNFGVDVTEQEWLVVRFTPSGQLDTSFGVAGMTTLHFSSIVGNSNPGVEIDYLNTMALTQDGQILVGGAVARTIAGAWTASWALAAFTTGATTTREWFQHDANFNETATLSSGGNVIQRYVYTPYGQQTVLTGAWAVAAGAANSVYGFQGGRYDAATGLNYFGEPAQTRVHGRDDLPTGTWMEKDPAGYIQGSNLYQLESSAPTEMVDPTGLAGGGPPGPTPPDTPPPATAPATQPASLSYTIVPDSNDVLVVNVCAMKQVPCVASVRNAFR